MDIEKKGLRADILFLAALFFTIFATLSVYSHSEKDPGYTLIVFTNYDQAVSNLFGKFGAYFSDWLGTFFGWTTFLTPFVFGWLTYQSHLHRRDLSLKWKRTIFRFALFLVLLYLFSTLTGFFGGHDMIFRQKPTGGIAGLFSADLFSSLLGKVGGVVICIFLILLDLLALFPRVIIGFLRGNVDMADLKDIINFKRKNEEPAEEYTEEIEPEYGDFDSGDKNITEDSSPVGSRNVKLAKTFGDDMPPARQAEVKSELVAEQAAEAEPEHPKTAKAAERSLSDTLTGEINIKAPVINEKAVTNYKVPVTLLDEPKKDSRTDTQQDLKSKSEMLVKKLKDFGVDGRIKEIQPGPVVTLYEFQPAAGVKINKIAGLSDDLALNMEALSVRIIAPIPGKAAVGIELPNKYRAMVSLRELLESKEYASNASSLTFAMGKNAAGKAYVSDLASMPHLLVAGTTGSGKSVSINTLICSIIYKASPDKVKFVMIDPKMVELSVYEDIPHLAAPVVTDARKAAGVLKNVVEEMENRYSLLASLKVRSVDSYNNKAEADPDLPPMPYLVVIVDEFADLMLVAGKEVEQSIIRIAQMARAVGIHLVLATQRPSVNVITGIIKANMPARLSFKVSSKVDSRTILDAGGAETLLGKGDSLFIPQGTNDTVRVHGCFVSDDEVGRIVEYLKSIGKPEYNMDLVREHSDSDEEVEDSEMDEMYPQALELVRQKKYASISMIQRYLHIGYNRSARIVEIMEKQGIIAPSDGSSKPREVLIKD